MKVSKNRDFFNQLGEIMDDVMFQTFFDSYFNDWDDCVAAVMLMKAYRAMSKCTVDNEKSLIINELRTCMKNGEFRHELASRMCSFMKHHKMNSIDN